MNLADGRLVTDGRKFRDGFHLDPLFTAQFFIPCGGPPEAVNVSNVHRLLDDKKQSRFACIVEGANLFFNQEARLKLEAAGAVIFKSASANKGGVTSSSLEVLAGLVFNDEEYERHMQVRNDGVVPEFRQRYISDVRETIKRNAELEFDCIDRIHSKSGEPRPAISNNLSVTIVKLKEKVEGNEIWENHKVRREVLGKALPRSLQTQLGLDKILNRLPESYLRAIFASFLASR